ncbi:MAG: hypothetical protein ICV55_03280 [Coleofasciculus sp. C3-bin4]|nr:hypothetical protein [Coleofasciculus sp. C3-bin4]
MNRGLVLHSVRSLFACIAKNPRSPFDFSIQRAIAYKTVVAAIAQPVLAIPR